LDYRRLGPFKIVEAVGNLAYRLDLPESMQIHDVFHVSLLQPVHPDFRADANPPPDPVIVDDTEEYEVEKVLDSRWYYKKLQYLVQWKGYGAEHNTWEAAANLENAVDIVKKFHGDNPARPNPDQPPSAGRVSGSRRRRRRMRV
jgi:hypothetical protein